VLNHLRALVKRRDAKETRIDLSILMESARQLIAMEGELKGVRIETAVARDAQPVLGDEIQIQQVLLNLAHNAMDAMEAVPAHERVLRLEVSAADDNSVLVRVADRGLGIAEAHAENVFEPFHTTKVAGLGIGLSICRAIVEAHGGSLWHVPNPGGGTVFQFTLPAEQQGG
jgi:C4-dicarboxylate-specific signal transduction histidine kinase